MSQHPRRAPGNANKVEEETAQSAVTVTASQKPFVKACRATLLTAAVLFIVSIVWPTVADLASATRRSGDPDSLELVLIDLPGQRIRLPRLDHFGMALPKIGNRTVVLLPGCNSCSVTPSGELKIPIGASEIIFIAHDSSELGHFKGIKSKNEARSWLVLDDKKKLAPSAAYDVAPIVLQLSQEGLIISAKGLL